MVQGVLYLVVGIMVCFDHLMSMHFIFNSFTELQQCCLKLLNFLHAPLNESSMTIV